MAEDTDVAPLKLPRYNTNIPNKRKLPESFAPSNGGSGVGVPGSNPHRMSQSKYIDRDTEDRMIAENKSNLPHMSRSKTFRESFSSGGYSVFKDYDSSSMPMYEITPISAGDFKLSDDPANRTVEDGANKWPLTETIKNLGIAAVSGSTRRNNFGECGFCTEPDYSGMPQDSVGDSSNANPEGIPVASNSRHKQRAHSEPAGPRKALTISEVSFSDNIYQSLRHPGSVHDITAPENLNPPLNLFEGSKTNAQQGHFAEPDHGGTQFEKPNVYTLDSQMIAASDTAQKPKGRRKKAKNRNQECFTLALTANMEIPRGSSPEKQMYQTDDQMASDDPLRGINYNVIIADKATLLSPRKASPKMTEKTSPSKNASPKGKPHQEYRNKSSPAKTTGGGGSSPPSPKDGRDSKDRTRSRSQDSSGGKKDNSPRKCEIKFTQNCHAKRRCSGKYFKPAFQGTFFKSLARVGISCLLYPEIIE